GFFAQDQWKITPKFTLNYGLRWDFESGLSQVVNPDYRGFQPRVGFAYSPTKTTVIRSGFGVFADHYNMTSFFVPYPQREVVIPNAAQPQVRKGNETATWVLNQLSFDAPSPANAGQPLPYPAPCNGTRIVPTPAQAAAKLVTTGQTPCNFNTGPQGTFV